MRNYMSFWGVILNGKSEMPASYCPGLLPDSYEMGLNIWLIPYSARLISNGEIEQAVYQE